MRSRSQPIEKNCNRLDVRQAPSLRGLGDQRREIGNQIFAVFIKGIRDYGDKFRREVHLYFVSASQTSANNFPKLWKNQPLRVALEVLASGTLAKIPYQISCEPRSGGCPRAWQTYCSGSRQAHQVQVGVYLLLHPPRR